MVLSGIVGTIVGGAIIGALARLIKPGADPMGWIVTILFGIGGAYLGSLVAHGGWWGWLVAIAVTVGLLYGFDAIRKKS